MTLEQFKCLSANDQGQVLKRKAVMIGYADCIDGLCVLLQVDGFYLEVFCSLTERYKVEAIFLFDDTDYLEPYLEAVNIDGVYEMLNN